MKVFVYYNLHKKCFSIKALSGEQKGKVIAHADAVVLDNVTFKVSESGRQRVLREHRKNVHAGVVGTLVVYSILAENISLPKYKLPSTRVTYDPYKYSSFVYKDTEQPIATATHAVLIKKRIFV